MISCPADPTCSDSRAAQRQKAAEEVLGPAVVSRIVGFALFLLGERRECASERVGMPLNTFLSFLTRMNRVGLDGLRDRREKPTVVAPAEALRIHCVQGQDDVVLRFLPSNSELSLPEGNPVQKKVVVLTLLSNDLLSAKAAAELLGVSPGYVRSLERRLADGDAAALLDRRCGQQQDYRVDEELKGKLVVRWAANAASGKVCSSRALAGELRDESNIEIADRTIRHHMKKLGLVGMAGAVRDLVEGIKKGS